MHSKRARDIVFIAVGLVLLLAAVGYTVYAVRFLIRTVDATIEEPGSIAPPPLRFNLEALEPLFESGKLERVTPPLP